MVTLKIVSSLDKLVYNACDPPMLSEGECAATELHNFQLVIFSTENFAGKLKVESDLHIDIYKQSFVKGTKKKEKNDEFFIKDCDEYPDPLELFEGDVQCDANKKICLWVSVPANQRVGIHTIKFSLLDAKAEYTLNIFDCVSQKRTLPITDWMHIDCICAMHGVTPYSKEFYDVFEKYISYYVLGGNTMLFTPIFTPALDIEEGKYRPTTQLLKIRKDGNKYIFDFSKVKEYIEFASARGVLYFEFSHLFTQWGAKHCPKIVDDNGTMLFGWDSDSYTSPYKKFLCQYFRALKKFATENALTHKIFIHISDEPSDEHAKHYIRLSK